MYIWPLPKVEFLSLDQIVEFRPVALVTTEFEWGKLRARLRLPVAWHAFIREATLPHWDELSDMLQSAVDDAGVAVIYALGGGLATDAAKYLAARTGLPLVALPTALSADVFFTSESAVREAGCVRHIETRPPDRLVVDLDVIAAAPRHLRAAGICDVLSIATGCWDWKFAEEEGKNPPGMGHVPYVAEAAQAILQGALACAESAGRGEPDGLKQLLDCLALEVQLRNQIGHSRPEKGSEHYFAYAVESEIGPELSHGELVGPGIVRMAALQGQDSQTLRAALHACRVPLDRIPLPVVDRTLRSLSHYAWRHDLPFGIAHTL